MILKDTHTCEHQAERFDEWTRIGRQMIEEVAGPRPCQSEMGDNDGHNSVEIYQRSAAAG